MGAVHEERGGKVDASCREQRAWTSAHRAEISAITLLGG